MSSDGVASEEEAEDCGRQEEEAAAVPTEEEVRTPCLICCRRGWLGEPHNEAIHVQADEEWFQGYLELREKLR